MRRGAYTPFEGEKSAWHDGFDRYDFVMDAENLTIRPAKKAEDDHYGVKAPATGQRRCIVIVPKEVAAGNPWSWRGCYWDHEPQVEVELLRRGFHVAFITPDPGKPWDAWYRYLTEQHGLSRKPAFVGMSRGGVNAYEWSTANPDKVSCIYADNPAIRPNAFLNLGDLARNDVSLLNVCGSFDFLLEKHTLAIENRYQQLGGRITVMIKEGTAHHPHSLRNPKPIADWIVQHIQPTDGKRPDFAGETFTKSYYYSLESSYCPLKEEKTYVTCRGPGFTECFDRFDAKTGSPWGITGMTIIVPRTAAPGKPWVFRADPIGLNAVVDQALLAKGYHIVVAPLIAQAGPVRQQWDAVYKLLVDHGFSRKPVMEGAGTAAGEAYAWAIENPDKVTCIYCVNPACGASCRKPSLSIIWPRWPALACRSSTFAAASTPGSTIILVYSRSSTKNWAATSRSSSRKARAIIRCRQRTRNRLWISSWPTRRDAMSLWSLYVQSSIGMGNWDNSRRANRRIPDA